MEWFCFPSDKNTWEKYDIWHVPTQDVLGQEEDTTSIERIAGSGLIICQNLILSREEHLFLQRELL